MACRFRFSAALFLFSFLQLCLAASNPKRRQEPPAEKEVVAIQRRIESLMGSGQNAIDKKVESLFVLLEKFMQISFNNDSLNNLLFDKEAVVQKQTILSKIKHLLKERAEVKTGADQEKLKSDIEEIAHDLNSLLFKGNVDGKDNERGPSRKTGDEELKAAVRNLRLTVNNFVHEDVLLPLAISFSMKQFKKDLEKLTGKLKDDVLDKKTDQILKKLQDQQKVNDMTPKVAHSNFELEQKTWRIYKTMNTASDRLMRILDKHFLHIASTKRSTAKLHPAADTHDEWSQKRNDLVEATALAHRIIPALFRDPRLLEVSQQLEQKMLAGLPESIGKLTAIPMEYERAESQIQNKFKKGNGVLERLRNMRNENAKQQLAKMEEMSLKSQVRVNGAQVLVIFENVHHYYEEEFRTFEKEKIFKTDVKNAENVLRNLYGMPPTDADATVKNDGSHLT